MLVTHSMCGSSCRFTHWFLVDVTAPGGPASAAQCLFRLARSSPISAVLVLSHLAIGQRRFHARYGPEIQAEPDRRRAIEKVFELVPQVDGTRYDVSRRVLRVVVHENPFATIRFPPTLFRGPYDERYGVRRADGSVQRMFCGRALRQLEREEHESGVSPLHARRFTKRPARSRSNPSSSGKTSD